MTDELLHRLVGLFGVQPFTSADAHRQLEAGLGAAAGIPALRAFSNLLRGALGRRIPYGGREVALAHAGTVRGGRRRWQFKVVPSEFGDDPDADLI